MTDIPDLSRLHTTPTVSSPRIGDQVANWVTTALGACADTDQPSWEVALQLLPTPQGVQPGYAVLVQIPSPVLGESLGHVALLDLGSLTEPVVAHHVRDAMERLRQQRTALLATPRSSNGQR